MVKKAKDTFSLESPSEEEQPPTDEEFEEAHTILDGDLLPGSYAFDKDNSRTINKSLSLAEYSKSWSKMEWLLFIEIYHIAKNFFTGTDAVNIQSYSQESLLVRVPVKMLNPSFFNPRNRSRQLRSAAEGLMDMRVRKDLNTDDGEQLGFDFITMFPRIKYDPVQDKDHILVKIQGEIYEEMIPIENIARLNNKVMQKLSAGNDNRLYSIIKSHAFKARFVISVTQLRKQMGFAAEGTYEEWGDLAKVLRRAVNNINKLKDYDIEVAFKKVPKKDAVRFEIKNYNKKKHKYAPILELNATIDPKTRTPNMIQAKYIRTTLANISKRVPISNQEQLMRWIISDLISQQRKQKRSFDFKHAINGISKQIINKVYTEPYAHKHLIKEANGDDSVEELVFDEFMHNEIKRLESKGIYDEIRHRFSDNELKAYRCGHLIDVLKELEELGEI